ncbi:MAG: glycosyltransferase family A protein, partial [Candidatus Kryptoniota bacterium]
MKPAIIISAYNRPEALMRLLHSVSTAIYPNDVPLVISIDFGGERQSEVLDVAERFEWDHGIKEIILHESHLGLNQHAFFIGSLSSKHGSVIRLEDDYYVSPVFYEYAAKALDFYKNDPRIGGISLYNVWFNGITHEPFVPCLDDSDVYFVQSSWAHGHVFLAPQWESYAAWTRQNDSRVSRNDKLHDSWAALDKGDWLPSATKYLAMTNRFYVFPRESLCTNFGDIGTHFKRASQYFQVPLQMRRRTFRFQLFEEAIAVYDAFQEILPDRLNRLTRDIASYDFEMDVNGTKSASKISHPYVVTTQPCVLPIRSWGFAMYPTELNIVECIPGTDIKLCRSEDLRPGGYAGLVASYRQYEYARSRLSVGLLKHTLFWIIRRIERIK